MYEKMKKYTLFAALFLDVHAKYYVKNAEDHKKADPVGQLKWYDWEKCSKSCGGGVRVRIASECVPANAVCTEMQIQREDCNMATCPNPEAEYNTALSAAKNQLKNYVNSFDMTSIGLTANVNSYVCPEASKIVRSCFEKQTTAQVNTFRSSCESEILQIMPEGRTDLLQYVDMELIPQIVMPPIAQWFQDCDKQFSERTSYSETFLKYFKDSQFFPTCKLTLPGKLSWYNWESCSKTCGGGTQTRIAGSCVPDYARCNSIQIERKECNKQTCPETPSMIIPVGSIVPWVPKPNSGSSQSVNYANHPGWIKCDGVETCSQGTFQGQKCKDLGGMALIGTQGNTYKVLDVLGATMPNHHHPHTHTTKDHTHRAEDHNHSVTGLGPLDPGKHTTGMGSKKGAAVHQHNLAGTSSSSSFTINGKTVTVKRSANSPVSSVSGNVVVNELYPKHMRVDFLFRCF